MENLMKIVDDVDVTLIRWWGSYRGVWVSNKLVFWLVVALASIAVLLQTYFLNQGLCVRKSNKSKSSVFLKTWISCIKFQKVT